MDGRQAQPYTFSSRNLANTLQFLNNYTYFNTHSMYLCIKYHSTGENNVPVQPLRQWKIICKKAPDAISPLCTSLTQGVCWWPSPHIASASKAWELVEINARVCRASAAAPATHPRVATQAVDNHTRRVSDRKRNSEVNNLETSNLRWQFDQSDCLLCHLTEVWPIRFLYLPS